MNEWGAYYEDGYDDGDIIEETALGTQISEAKFSGTKKVLIVKVRKTTVAMVEHVISG